MSEENQTPATPAVPPAFDAKASAQEEQKATRAPRKKREAKPAEPMKAVVSVRAKVAAKYHPYQRVRIPVANFIELPMDNWLDVQIKAGVIVKA